MNDTIRDVVFVDGVRTPFGKAGKLFEETRADDMIIRCIRSLLRRNPGLPPERVDEVALAATTQIGDQGRVASTAQSGEASGAKSGTDATGGGAKQRLDEMIPEGHAAEVHLTMTDDHPFAQAFVIITAVPRSQR